MTYDETYNVWCPEEGETEEDAALVKAWDHSEAAKEFVEKRYQGDPFDGPMEVIVRNHLGGLFRISVHPEPTVQFYAHVQEGPS